jgi:hypothetical protein
MYSFLDNILSDVLNMDTVVINAAGSVYFSQGSTPQQVYNYNVHCIKKNRFIIR